MDPVLPTAFAIVAVPVAALLMWLWWGESRARGRLAARPCPHCGAKLGRIAAARAWKSPLGPEPYPNCIVFDIGMRHVECLSCGRESFLYIHTEEIAGADTGVRKEGAGLCGIPESSRSLPTGRSDAG